MDSGSPEAAIAPCAVNADQLDEGVIGVAACKRPSLPPAAGVVHALLVTTSQRLKSIADYAVVIRLRVLQ
jgi:hypothetical protein